jgi:uncharacterized protein with PQ loop repeat
MFSQILACINNEFYILASIFYAKIFALFCWEIYGILVSFPDKLWTYVVAQNKSEF